MGGVLSRSQKMFSLLLLPSAALAWAPAPGIPLERQIPVNRQTTGAGSGSGSACDFEPWTQECNATQIWCDSGYYNDYTCWYGNYCLDQVSSWDAAPESATCPATGTLRSTATWVWTATDAGWATTACPSSLVDVLPLQAPAATMAAVLAVLEPASNLTLRSATALRSTVTLDMTLISAGMETTASTR